MCGLSSKVEVTYLGTIAATFEVSDCSRAPARNLEESDFELLGNDMPIDISESSRTILDRKAAAFVTIVLDNSPSVTAANAVDVVADAALAYANVALSNTEQIYLSVASFSRRFTVLMERPQTTSREFAVRLSPIESMEQEAIRPTYSVPTSMRWLSLNMFKTITASVIARVLSRSVRYSFSQMVMIMLASKPSTKPKRL